MPIISLTWRLLLVLWVGAFCFLDLLLPFALWKVGLAPLLVEDIDGALAVFSVKLAGIAVLVQILLLILAQGWPSPWRDARGRLLVATLALAVLFAILASMLPGAPYALRLVHGLMGICGLLLVVKPAPSGR